ncbi:hypothetical protein SGCZBJ_13190 [Caulobacter zeae]|uniref:Uncharacterized protein n=1 Tax=Caulobacter zeae TaxID=2055137 RepID=A0A2N5DGI1_9CAUL|nr:hypothetical protein [Caulobacter zeae]PLR25179.1 hypothetical protein SGCZBJ_13190 [Caulobacter zeae]
MLSEQARQVVEKTRTGRKVALVFRVQAGVDRVALRNIKDVVQRNRQLDTIYEIAKQPVLEAVSKYESAGFQIVDHLAGTPRLVVSAPAQMWRQILRDNVGFVTDPTIEVMPNEPFRSAPL